MMKFRTEYKIERAPFILTPEKPSVLLGSCFADNMRRRMRGCLWNGFNPFGVLYNPLSISRALRLSLYSQDSVAEFDETLFHADGLWRSWLFDSSLASSFKDESGRLFYSAAEELSNTLKDSEALFVTFGTSWCWFLAESPGFAVGNCHKQPASRFVRRRLTEEEIVTEWEDLAFRLKSDYPDLRIVFTVSPVRHLKEGFAGNMRSKAVLLLAVEELCRRIDFCHYFPAYEIMNDDLRDYRFYASDLAHPSEEAADYIWDIFKATYLDESGIATLREGESLVRRLNHRPLIPDSRKSEELLAADRLRKSDVIGACNDFSLSHPGMINPL